MTEQHEGLPVAGYRPQPQKAIDTVNGFKMDEEHILRKLDALASNGGGAEGGVDQRWLAIGRTKIEEAFMAINRSIFKPGRVTLSDD